MLHYFDRASMAHSLEVRVPFLDHRVVEYCAGIPAELKVRRLTTKYLLKRASRGILPDRIIDKRKIGFFAASIDGWFRDQADGAITEYLLAPHPHYADMLDPQVVRSLVRRHAEAPGQADSRLLLAILMLEVWLSSFLPRALGQTNGRPIEVPIRPSASQAEPPASSRRSLMPEWRNGRIERDRASAFGLATMWTSMIVLGRAASLYEHISGLGLSDRS